MGGRSVCMGSMGSVARVLARVINYIRKCKEVQLEKKSEWKLLEWKGKRDSARNSKRRFSVWSTRYFLKGNWEATESEWYSVSRILSRNYDAGQVTCSQIKHNTKGSWRYWYASRLKHSTCQFHLKSEIVQFLTHLGTSEYLSVLLPCVLSIPELLMQRELVGYMTLASPIH